MGSQLQDITSGGVPYVMSVQQIIAALKGEIDVSQFVGFAQIQPPTTSVSLSATGSGSLNGVYQYKVAFVTGFWSINNSNQLGTLIEAGNTSGGPAATITANNAGVSVSNIPIGPSGTVARVLYRTQANGSSFYYLTTIYNNQQTTYQDTAPDSSLGSAMPTTNTTGTKFVGDGSLLTNVPASQLQGGPIPTAVLPPAGTNVLGTVEVSAPPASGQNPVAVATTDANWSKLTGGTTSVADSEHTHQNFPDAVTFNGGATVPSGETLTLAGTEMVTGTLEASGSGVINATELGGQVASNYPLITQANTFQGIQTAPAFATSGLTGATSASRYVGATTSGAPTSGTFQVGDFVIDQTAKIWICTVAGSPGTWQPVGGGAVTATYMPGYTASTPSGSVGVAANVVALPPKAGGYSIVLWVDTYNNPVGNSSGMSVQIGNTIQLQFNGTNIGMVSVNSTSPSGGVPVFQNSEYKFGGYFQIVNGYLQFMCTSYATNSNSNNSDLNIVVF